MTENGADYSKLELVFYTADYRGVVAKTDIKEGEIALFVPYDICVTIEHAKETPFGKYINENDVHDDVVGVTQSMDSIRREQIQDQKITDEKKNEYLSNLKRLSLIRKELIGDCFFEQ